MSGAFYPPSIPRVKGVRPAGTHAVTLTLESGEELTVNAVRGTCMHPEGLLVTDCFALSSLAYLIPSPHQRWQANVWLGLYNGHEDSPERRFDEYLMALASIVEVNWTDEVLTLACIGRTGQRITCQFAGDVTVHFIDAEHLTNENFTQYPIRVAVQEGQGDGVKGLIGFRVDHTPEGYAALLALGWDAPLPDLEARR